MNSQLTAYKYFAFISYSRKDSKAAAWLQRRLEWFRFPVKLVPEELRPPHPRYIQPVYRDKTNLEVTDEHYWTNIRRALEESRYLIVLCSPNSAVSEPVNLEVAHFLDTHGGDASLVAPVIVSGNVTSSGEDVALCPALRELGHTLIDRNLPTVVPDAVSNEQDAWEQGFVSLVSYLLRLERSALGDHIQRETKRQARVLRRWLVAVGMLTVIAVVLACLAINAKREVEKANAVIVEKNTINLKNLHEASMADYAVAVQRIEKDGKWREGVAHLARSLRWESTNRLSASRLYQTLLFYGVQNCDQPRLIIRNGGPVLRVQFSPDGSLVATASSDHTARVWDARTGKAMGEPMRHEDVVHSAQFSPDGSLVATASSDHTARVWDARTGKAMGEPMRHEDVVQSAQFSPDGSLVATASSDHTARVWDARTGRAMGEPMRHEDVVQSAQYSPDGSRVVTASSDHTARVWDARTGRVMGEPMRHEGAVQSAQFSPDGSLVATAGLDNTARIWDAKTCKALGGPMLHKNNCVMSIEFSPDGTNVITTSCGSLYGDHSEAIIWDLDSRQPTIEPLRSNDEITSAQFSLDGMRIITSSRDRTAQIWDAKSGKPLCEPLHHDAGLANAAFSPDGVTIATANLDGTSSLWNARFENPQGEPFRHKKWVTKARFSPNGKYLVTASVDHTARIWDALKGNVLATLQHYGIVADTQFSTDSSRVITASWDGTARIWNAETGEPVGDALHHDDVIFGAEFNPGGTRVLTSSADGTARLWDVATSQPVGKPIIHNGPVWDAHFSPDGTRFVTAGSDGTARVWDTMTGKTTGEIMHHDDEVHSAHFSPDGSQIITASHDGTARIWNALTGKPLGEPLRHNDIVNGAEFSPDSTRILTSSIDGTARLWDATTCKPIGESLEHRIGVESAHFSRDGILVVTSCQDGYVRLWDVQTCKLLGEPMHHTDEVRDAQFDSDGLQVVSSCKDGAAWVWNVRKMTRPPIPVPQWVLEYACVIAGVEFDLDGGLHRIPSAVQNRSMKIDSPVENEWSRLVSCMSQAFDKITPNPDSVHTVRQIVISERDSGTKEGIESALRYDPTVPLAHVLLAKFEDNPQRADFLRGYGLKLLPPNDEILWARAAASLVEQKDFKRALQAADKALALDPKNEAAQKARAAAIDGAKSQ